MLDKGGKSIAALMFALLVAIFAFQLNASMLSPALATMAEQLHTTNTEVNLSQTVFFTAAALFSLFLPRLADLVGRKKTLTGMLLLTGIGCIVSALAPNVTVLMIGRILQGVSGPVVPLCLIILHVRVTEDAKYARLMAILTSVNGGIGGVDALLGGWLAGTFGFRSVFWVMAGIAILGVLAVWFFAEESTAAETPKMDWLGVVCLGIAFLAAYLVTQEIQKLAAANWVMVGTLTVIAIVFFVLFWQVEKRKKNPLVSVHYMKQRRTWGLLLTTLVAMTGVFAIMNGIVPQLAQDSKYGVGLSATTVSFCTLTPYALLGLVFGPVAGVLASKFGYRKVLRGGLLLTGIGVLFGVYLAFKPSIWAALILSMILGLTYAGTVNIMLNGLGIVLSPKDNPGYLPGMNASMFNLGAGLSFAILSMVMNAFTASAGAPMGYASAMIGCAVLTILALALSFLIPNPETLKD
ncbi:MAG: MFS transporter [Bifidobacterium sp.]|nr:MFS transporter [Bifidobacterium sp.]